MNEAIYNRISDFAMIFLGLAMSAIPFVVIGVTLSCLIAKWISPDWVRKHRSKNSLLSHIQVMFIGMFLPVCQCGNVPLAKRLSVIGFRPSEVITFMLAAPIFNPIVLITTLVAFNLDPNVAWIRVLGGGLIALTVGLIFSLHPQPSELLVSSQSDRFIQPKKGFSFNAALQAPDPTSTEPAHDGSFVDSWRDDFLMSSRCYYSVV
jgi:uncharacterized protein